MLERQTRRRTLQQNIAIFPKPDYILLIVTRNQLPSIVSEGTEAEATVMEQGVNLLANFPLPSPLFFWLRKFAKIFLSIAVWPGIFARRVSFRKRGFPATLCMPGNPRFPETRLAIGQNHHNLKSRAWAVWIMESSVCVTISTKESLISRCISDVN